MPTISRKVNHDLGKAEAKKRVDHFLQKARSLSNLQGEWAADTYPFSVTVQGIRLQGQVQVSDTALGLDAQVPLLAMPFVGWFGKILTMALKEVPSASTTSPQQFESAADPALAPVLLFLHIPKAAGTTLSEYLSGQCSGPILETQDDLFKGGIYYGAFGFLKDPEELLPAYVIPYLGRADLRAVFGHFSFGIHSQVQRPWHYVTMLRNPVDRVLSLYYFLNAGGANPIEDFFTNPTLRELDNDQTRRIAGVEPPFGQCTQNHLDMAKQNLREHFAMVGLAERFDASILLMKQKFGWEKQFGYYPRNVTHGRPIAESLPQNVITRIKELNQLDEELYQYAHQLMDEYIANYSGDFYADLETFQQQKLL